MTSELTFLLFPPAVEVRLLGIVKVLRFGGLQAPASRGLGSALAHHLSWPVQPENHLFMQLPDGLEILTGNAGIWQTENENLYPQGREVRAFCT